MFDPRLALASLSGESDVEWATRGAPYAGFAVLGGIAIDDASQAAAETLVERGRSEFLTDDPIGLIDDQLRRGTDLDIGLGVNVRSATIGPVADAAAVCADHGAAIEINAHCRQPELCAIGCGETLLVSTDRLAAYVRTAAETGATVGVKVRAEVSGVDLPKVARTIERAGAAYVHVDAMDTEPVVADVVDATELFVIANNEVRDAESVREYLGYGADAVSVGRPSDDPVVLDRVRRAVEAWFAGVYA